MTVKLVIKKGDVSQFFGKDGDDQIPISIPLEQKKTLYEQGLLNAIKRIGLVPEHKHRIVGDPANLLNNIFAEQFFK